MRLPFQFSLAFIAVSAFMTDAVELHAQDSDPDLLIVSETAWGFDGRVPLHRFVPLSVQVKNLGATPWLGTLNLTRVLSGSRQLGATLAINISLQGDETRWFQFTPYVIDDMEDWELRWGDGENHFFQLPPVIKSDRSTVLVYNTDAVSQETTIFKRMPEERFPTSVTGTDGLRGVILNDVPFWQGARAKALHDWIILGGRVYILHDSDQEFPRFPVALSFLNSEQQRFRIGAGVVKRIPREPSDFSLDEARVEIFNDDWSTIEQRRKEVRQTALSQQYNSSGYGYVGWNTVWSKHYDLFKDLSELSKFKRHWWLIYISVFAYLATLYPGCYIIGTQQKNVSQFYGLFLSSVCFFALIFSLLGQVGGRSENRVRSVAIARSLGDGSFDVTGWTMLANIFAGDQTISHPGSGIAYTTTQEAKIIHGTMNPGTGGEVTINMLPDSKQTLHYRSKIRTNLALPKVISSNSDETRIRVLSIEITNAFEEEPLYALALIQGMIYELETKGNFLELSTKKQPKRLSTFLQRPYEFGRNLWWGTVKPDEDEEEEELVGLKQYIKLVRPLIGNSFGLSEEIDPRIMKIDLRTIRLFVLTTAPLNMQVETEDFPDREGAVLFTYDLKL